LIAAAADIVWGPWTIALLFFVGVLLTWKCRFVQLRRFPDAIRATVAHAGGSRGVLSPFQAFATATAASIGTGNIAGVATAIVAGGPGALFWIWAYGFFAAAVKFAEAVLGLEYRKTEAGHVLSGPMYYLRDGARAPRLAWVFALCAGLAALLTTPFTQPNSIAVVLESQFKAPRVASGIVIALLTWAVVIGGIRSIGRVAAKLAPLKVGVYLVGGLAVLVSHGDRIPGVLALVLKEAFSTRSVSGGALGISMMQAVRFGLARGVMASEAGYGTAAVAYGTARSEEPLQQGLGATIEVFIISFVVSSISGLTVLVAGAWQGGLNSTALVAQAFDSTIPHGGWMVAICATLFGYTTLVGWSYYGEQFLEYAFGRSVARPYRWLYCALVILGACLRVETVWAWGDLLNGLQIFPNVFALVVLSDRVAAVARAPRPSRAIPRIAAISPEA
jgi:alanine or glycine:cation symporter, AGCS family